MTKRTRIALTARQQEVLSFIVSYTTDVGWAPSVREMQEAFGIESPNGVICHLNALERKGYIERGANLSRAIRVIL